jgi:protein-S-isoprenylcysteine O-methyltransferase Ste14
MGDWFEGIRGLPPYGIGGVLVMVLYAIQAELRFGRKARSYSAGAEDRGSSAVISLAAVIPVLGFVFAMKAPHSTWIPAWYRDAVLPGMPAIAWAGVAMGVAGFLVRLWSVLTLRERYTRTLLTHDEHTVERGGPYRWVRHPGYLGSLLVLNGIALASGNWIAPAVSVPVTVVAYLYRIRAEDRMLVAAFGEGYAAYRREVGALLPRI